MEYLIFQNGQTKGPFTIDALRSMRITPDTLVLPQGMTQWIPAGQVEELRSLFTEQFVNDERVQPVQNDINPSVDTSTTKRNNDYSKNFVWLIMGIMIVGSVILGKLSGSDSDRPSSQSTMIEVSYGNVPKWLTEWAFVSETEDGGKIIIRLNENGTAYMRVADNNGTTLRGDYNGNPVEISYEGDYIVRGNNVIISFDGTSKDMVLEMDTELQRLYSEGGGVFKQTAL